MTRGPLPIVVGVTGHRDIRPDDIPALEGLVRATLAEAQARFPHSRFVLLSPLAEGSDRLVARVAREFNASLVVPLPMPVGLYQEDFDRPDSQREFTQLLAAADGTFELPLVNGNTLAGIGHHGEQRNRQYAQVGAFIARHSQILLALWDGVSTNGGDKVGGTGDVVRFRLEGAPREYEPARTLLTFASHGPVHHIVTPRQGRPVPPDALTRSLLLPPGGRVRSFDHLHWMDRFNRDAQDQQGALEPGVRTGKARLLQASEDELARDEQALAPPVRITLERYAVADGLALIFGQRSRRTSRDLFLCVFAAALSVTLFLALPHAELSPAPTTTERFLAAPWLLLVSLGASLVGVLWVQRRARSGDDRNKHQDYRALAEALRVQFFWGMAAIEDRVVDHYLRKQSGTLEWIRDALRAWDVESLASGPAATSSPADRLAFVRHHWILPQREYYAARARAERACLERERRQARLLVGSSLGLAVTLALCLTIPLLIEWPPLEAIRAGAQNPWSSGVVLASIVTLAVIAGLRHTYTQHMSRAAHAKMYSRMAGLFDTADRRLVALVDAADHGEADRLLKDLGEEALEENGNWVLLHRERPSETHR